MSEIENKCEENIFYIDKRILNIFHLEILEMYLKNWDIKRNLRVYIKWIFYYAYLWEWLTGYVKAILYIMRKYRNKDGYDTKEYIKNIK